MIAYAGRKVCLHLLEIAATGGCRGIFLLFSVYHSPRSGTSFLLGRKICVFPLQTFVRCDTMVSSPKEVYGIPRFFERMDIYMAAKKTT